MPKVSIEKQLKVLPWIYGAAFLLFVVLGAQIVGFFRVMVVADEKGTHSREVIKANNDAKNLFLEAETKGRYASFDKAARKDFPELSVKAIELAKQLPEIVSDNETQTSNAERIIETVEARFSAQEKTIQTAQVVNGTLQSNQNLVLNGVDAQTAAINAFITFEAEEQRLSLQRYEAFWSSLWSIGERGAGAFILLALTSLLSGGWVWRTLRKSWHVLQDLGNGKAADALKSENRQLHEKYESLQRAVINAVARLDS